MTKLEFIAVLGIIVLAFCVNVAIFLLLARVDIKREAKRKAEWWKEGDYDV